MVDEKQNIFKKIKKSIFEWELSPKEEHKRLGLIVRSLILHLHPPKINKKVLKFTHTFGLGGMAIVLICVQYFTGLLLRFFYVPSPGRAYDSIISLQNDVLFGQLIRNLHHWSAVILLIITFLHFLRVFFTSAFHGKRQFNWVIGLSLLIIIIFSNFTGYLLPWDQLSYWAVTVSTNMLEYIPLFGNTLKEILIGGKEIGETTLLIFYNFHTGILPIALMLIMAFHFWRVRKAGGVVVPKSSKEDKFVTTIPHLVAKEFVAALVLIAVIFILGLIFNAPLLEKANPNISPNPAKAPWYFMGIQELILHLHPLFSAIIIPLTVLIAALLIPYFNYHSEDNGRWFYSDRAANIGLKTVLFSFVITFLLVVIDEYVIDLETSLNFLPSIISNGFIPFGIMIFFFYAFYKYLRNSKKLNNNEVVQTIFIFVISSFLVLTFIGIMLRGEGMALKLF